MKINKIKINTEHLPEVLEKSGVYKLTNPLFSFLAWPFEKINRFFDWIDKKINKSVTNKISDINEGEPKIISDLAQYTAINFEKHNELSEMFANLLKISISKDTKDLLLPSYVEALKQLSPEEAKIINDIYNNAYDLDFQIPLILAVNKWSDPKDHKLGFKCLLKNYSANFNVDRLKMNIFISNWLKLGIFEIPVNLRLVQKDCYKNSIEKIETMLNVKNINDKHEEYQIVCGIMRLTDFGKELFRLIFEIKN